MSNWNALFEACALLTLPPNTMITLPPTETWQGAYRLTGSLSKSLVKETPSNVEMVVFRAARESLAPAVAMSPIEGRWE